METKYELKNLLNQIEKDLPTPSKLAIGEFIEVGEWGLALETMCDLLYEYEVSISSETFRLIQETSRLLQTDKKIWEELSPQISQ